MGKSKLILVHGHQGCGNTTIIRDRIRKAKFENVYNDYNVRTPSKFVLGFKDAAIVHEIGSVRELVRKNQIYRKSGITVFFEFQSQSGVLTPEVFNLFDEVINVKWNSEG